MAAPLRNGHPEFDDEQEVTTADLAHRKAPASEKVRPQVLQSAHGDQQRASAAIGGSIQEAPGDGSTPLFPSSELESLRVRWKETQTAFVDKPRKAVEQADGLVASAMKRLAEVFAEERLQLEKQWDRGDTVSTEDLRVALQRYRTFFDRLLSV
ncbi:MAG TPA: hypothetical protein VMG82_01275 [Candidatus Sulfotelmatobacter sp.]|nr:hypothetical protein [Candidatus Sulfotelmatobacter sp.]